jgi:hypothetical protein
MIRRSIRRLETTIRTIVRGFIEPHQKFVVINSKATGVRTLGIVKRVVFAAVEQGALALTAGIEGVIDNVPRVINVQGFRVCCAGNVDRSICFSVLQRRLDSR